MMMPVPTQRTVIVRVRCPKCGRHTEVECTYRRSTYQPGQVQTVECQTRSCRERLTESLPGEIVDLRSAAAHVLKNITITQGPPRTG
jgi:hypothetical protein